MARRIAIVDAESGRRALSRLVQACIEEQRADVVFQTHRPSYLGSGRTSISQRSLASSIHETTI